jgi:hypothetical protein
MENADGWVIFEQPWQAATQNGFSLIFVKFLQHQRVGKRDAGFPAHIAHDSEGVFLSDARASAGAVKNDVVTRPVLSEETGLRFSEFRQLIVIRLKERSLRMTDEKDNPHF